MDSLGAAGIGKGVSRKEHAAEGVSATLFETNPKETLATSQQYIYDVDASGERFLVNTLLNGAEVQPMTVVLHWQK